MLAKVRRRTESQEISSYVQLKPKSAARAGAIVGALCATFAAVAAEPNPAQAPTADSTTESGSTKDEQQYPPGYFAWAEDSRGYVDDQLQAWSQRIDSFFGGDTAFEESVGSYGSLRVETTIEDDGNLKFRLNGRVKLALPRTEQRWKLVVQPESEAEGADDIGETPTDPDQDDNLTAALRFLNAESKKWKVTTDFGVRFTVPLDPYLRLRIRRNWFVSDWLVRGTETLSYYESEGFTARTGVDLEKRQSRDNYFRSSSVAKWKDEDQLFDLGQTFSLFRKLSTHRAIEYRLGFYGQTEPAIQLNETLVRVRFRQLIHRDWLFFEAAPEITWPRDERFSATPAITFKLEAITDRLPGGASEGLRR